MGHQNPRLWHLAYEKVKVVVDPHVKGGQTTGELRGGRWKEHRASSQAGIISEF